jgi:hypothetical protein
MTKKWMAISLLMFVVACLLGWWLQSSIGRFDADNNLDNLQSSRDMMQKMAAEPPLPQPSVAENYIAEEFAVIPENNVFSESRSREEEATEEEVPIDTRPLSRKPVLVGISITDSQKTSLLVDPRESSQGRSSRAEIKRIGDVYQGYAITEIAPDHIVLESGSQKEIIPLHEGSKNAAGGRTPILSTRVVSIGGGAASGGQPIVNAGQRVAAVRSVDAPQRAVDAVPNQPAVATNTTIVTPVSQARPEAAVSAQQSAARAQQPQRTPSRQPAQSTGSSTPKTRVVRTPFGDIVRPARD